MLSFLVVLMANGGFCNGREFEWVLLKCSKGHNHWCQYTLTEQLGCQGYILMENEKFDMCLQAVLFDSMFYMLC